jgi:hypothetical protein
MMGIKSPGDPTCRFSSGHVSLATRRGANEQYLAYQEGVEKRRFCTAVRVMIVLPKPICSYIAATGRCVSMKVLSHTVGSHALYMSLMISSICSFASQHVILLKPHAFSISLPYHLECPGLLSRSLTSTKPHLPPGSSTRRSGIPSKRALNFTAGLPSSSQPSPAAVRFYLFQQ